MSETLEQRIHSMAKRDIERMLRLDAYVTDVADILNEKDATITTLRSDALALAQRVAALEGAIQKIHDGEDEGSGTCRYCGADDYAVDEQGNRIYGDNVSDAVEYHFPHAEWCPSLILDNAVPVAPSPAVAPQGGLTDESAILTS